MIFPLWLLQTLIIGSIAMCIAGAVMLVAFLIVDSKDKKIW